MKKILLPLVLIMTSNVAFAQQISDKYAEDAYVYVRGGINALIFLRLSSS
ncbi:hypothetical protein [Rahnella ecdela]|uniref:Uncharacterized protein n=1 Tax=Rahnella ecdela TaxID=2816250 RepID=A0ABS6LAC5_9GAMM|nr:hypothetical protein [Rahnella ecdela]MBU9843895.1 hypothetical protein [Rahnella ecdela]